MSSEPYLTRLAKAISTLAATGMLENADSDHVRRLADGEVSLRELKQELEVPQDNQEDIDRAVAEHEVALNDRLIERGE